MFRYFTDSQLEIILSISPLSMFDGDEFYGNRNETA